MQTELDFNKKKMESMQDHIDNLAGDKWKFEQKTKELEFTSQTQDDIYQALETKNKKQEADIAQCRQEIDNLKAQLSEEQISQKRFYDKFTEAQEKLLSTTEQFNKQQRELVCINDLKQDRDKRLSGLRAELTEVIEENDRLKQ